MILMGSIVFFLVDVLVRLFVMVRMLMLMGLMIPPMFVIMGVPMFMLVDMFPGAVGVFVLVLVNMHV